MRRLGKLAKPPPVRHDLVLIGMRLQIPYRQCGQGEAQDHCSGDCGLVDQNCNLIVGSRFACLYLCKLHGIPVNSLDVGQSMALKWG
jgi:hypothetical protein